MNELIALFPEQLEEALKIAQSFTISKPEIDWQNVIISGMGGSGIGGSIVRDYAASRLSIPIVVNKTYDLPQFADSKSLIIICSYSGNTEETISVLQQAIEKNAFVVCISSGGKIETIAHKNQLPFIKLPSGQPPRACLGYALIQILNVLLALGLLEDTFIEEIKKSAQLLKDKKEVIQEKANTIAGQTKDKIFVIYAGNQMAGAATRWRQQINENSKLPGWSSAIPEMNHNELVGWRDQYDNLAVVFLHSPSDHPRVKTRMAINKNLIEKCTNAVFDVEALGTNYWEQVFSLIHLGDWLSWYLSELRQVDAMEVKVIDFLKKELAS